MIDRNLTCHIGKNWKRWFRCSQVESCPRCGQSYHFMVRNSHKASNELRRDVKACLIPDLTHLETESGWSLLSPWPSLYGKNNQKQLLCLGCMHFKYYKTAC